MVMTNKQHNIELLKKHPEFLEGDFSRWYNESKMKCVNEDCNNYITQPIFAYYQNDPEVVLCWDCQKK